MNKIKKYMKEYHKKYRKLHQKELNKKAKEYKQKNKQKISNKMKKYYQLHKEEIKKKCKKYRDTHKKIHRKYMQKYYKIHKARYIKYSIKYIKEWLKNPINRLITNYRSRINNAIKENTKGKSTKKLIGCSIKFLKSYLESKFTKGMSWKNYGYYGWHIDHIKPCSKFDLSKKSEQQKCFHYTNLQPLWMKDNLKKYNNIKV